MRPSPPRPDATACYRVVDLHTALTTRYQTDAHLVCYTCDTPTGMHHRLRKDFAGEYRWPPTLGVLMADVDNTPHQAWAPETRAAAQATFDRLVGEGFGVYTTNKGYRVIALLERPVRFDEAEPFIRALHFKLSGMGVSPDPQCKDWTRHYRLPFVMRSGKPTTSELML